MDKNEAREIQAELLGVLRNLNYSTLVKRFIDQPSEKAELSGPSGQTYQVQTQAFWDDGKDGNLRVMVLVDDGGWRAFLPLSHAFVIAPDGSFVVE